jgi:HEAT repeat protein
MFVAGGGLFRYPLASLRSETAASLGAGTMSKFQKTGLRLLFLVAAGILLSGGALPAQTASLIEKLLADESHLAALKEIEKLDEASRRKLVPPLISAMRDGKRNQAFHGARGLASIGSPALPALLAEIRSPDEGVAGRAFYALGTMGTAAIPSLVPLLKDRPDIACLAAQALQQMHVNAAAAIPELVQALTRPEEGVRYCAAHALGATGSPAALPGLRQAMGVYPGAALTAIAALGPAGREAFPDVVSLLDSPYGGAAARALGQIGRGLPETVEALNAALLSLPSNEKGIAAEELGEMGEWAAGAVPNLIATLSDANARISAARALGKIASAPEDSVPALMALWTASDRYTRSVAEQAVASFGQAAVPALIAGLEDRAMEIRVNAARHLGELRASEAVPQLVRALQDPDPSVQAGSALALERIDTPQAREAVSRFRSSLPPARRQWTRGEALAAIPPTQECPEPLRLVLEKDVEGANGGELLITVHRGDRCADRLAIWRKAAEGYEKIQSIYGPEVGMAAFREVNNFRQAGEQFIHIMLRYDGTGHMHENTILWLAPDLTLHPVEFLPGPKGFTGWEEDEELWSGEANTFSDQQMTFRFGIYRWPEGYVGEVRGDYELVGEKRFEESSRGWTCTFEIRPGAYQRQCRKSMPK